MAATPDFKTSFTQILRDLQENGGANGEALAAVGGLAAIIAAQLQVPSWSEAKTAMSEGTHNKLLKRLETDGVAQLKAGNHNGAYAAQVIAVSMIARRYRSDPEMQTGEALLDQLIDYAASVHNGLTKIN